MYAEYNSAELVADPHEAVDMIQALRRQGVRANEFAFTSTSVGRLALSAGQRVAGHVGGEPAVRR